MMNLEPLGELTRDSTIDEWLISDSVPVPYFGGLRMSFVLDGIDEDASPADFSDAVRTFLELDVSARLAASNEVFRNYQASADVVPDVRIENPEAVWNFVASTQIYVVRRYGGDELVYVRITAECAWDREHGLQIVYRKGCELSRVSEQDGHLA